MSYDQLKKGYRVHIHYFEDGNLKYKESPVYDKKGLNERLALLDEDNDVERYYVHRVAYKDKRL